MKSVIPKTMDYHFIYKTTNLINGKIYIGLHSTKDLNDGYLGSGKIVLQAIEKYGKENFKRDILEFCDKREDLSDKEKYWINIYNAISEGYNLREGGLNMSYSVPKNEGTRRKISDKLKGRKLSKEHKENVIKNRKKPVWTEESKEKARQRRLGKPIPEDVRLKMSTALRSTICVTDKSLAALDKGRMKVVCPHCGKTGGMGPMHLFHFDNCLFRKDMTEERRLEIMEQRRLRGQHFRKEVITF